MNREGRSSLCRRGPRAAALAISGLLLGAAPAAWALQPLEQFVRAARGRDPANREASASAEAAAAQADQALGRALPGVSAVAAYSRNQHEVEFNGLAVMPINQRDATIQVTVPLIDLGEFARIAAANRREDAAGHQRGATLLESEAQVVQSYYQLAANLALVQAARKSLEAVRVNHTMTSEAFAAGTATSLDVERARAEVERQTQQVVSAELAAKLAARALESRTGITADTSAGVPLSDDLHPEPPLAQFARLAGSTPALRVAVSDREAADQEVRAAKLGLFPTIRAHAIQRFTNATGFMGGHARAYTAVLTASWSFDFGTVPGIRARSAEAAAARAREEAARLAVGDAIFQAWSTIEASLARSRSARAEAAVSAQAAEIARSRYRAGVASQLELIQADRDAFSAEAARIQSDADLLNARRQLRIAAGASVTGM